MPRCSSNRVQPKQHGQGLQSRKVLTRLRRVPDAVVGGRSSLCCCSINTSHRGCMAMER